MDRLGRNPAQMFLAGIGAAPVALSFRRRTRIGDPSPAAAEQLGMTVFTLYMASIVFYAVAILVVFELINRR